MRSGLAVDGKKASGIIVLEPSQNIYFVDDALLKRYPCMLPAATTLSIRSLLSVKMNSGFLLHEGSLVR